MTLECTMSSNKSLRWDFNNAAGSEPLHKTIYSGNKFVGDASERGFTTNISKPSSTVQAPQTSILHLNHLHSMNAGRYSCYPSFKDDTTTDFQVTVVGEIVDLLIVKVKLTLTRTLFTNPNYYCDVRLKD